MKKVYSTCLIVLLSLFLIFQILYTKKTDEDTVRDKNVAALAQNDSVRLTDYVGMDFLEYDKPIFENYHGELKSIEDLINREDVENYIFVRMSAQGCRPCFDKLLESLTELKSEIENLNIIILMKDIPLRDMMVLQRTKNKYNFEFLYIKALGLDYQYAYRPIIFTLGKDLRITTYHICNKDRWDTTEQYLHKVLPS